MNRGMNQYYQEALRKCLAGLVQSIPSILDLVLVKMNMHFLPIQQETIQSQPNSVAKVTEFVKILTTMTNEAFHTFLGVLDQLHYRHVANEIRLAANMPVQVPPHSSKCVLKMCASYWTLVWRLNSVTNLLACGG